MSTTQEVEKKASDAELLELIDLESLSAEDLNKAIERCQKALQAIEKKRIDEVQAKIKELASSINMTPEQVVMNMQRKLGSKSAPKAVRFRNPDNAEQTWSGRGKRPAWLTEKLDAGADLESFRVAE